MKSLKEVGAQTMELLHRLVNSTGCVATVVFVAFVLTVIAVSYRPPDLELEPASKMANMLDTVVQNATFERDDTILPTGEDILGKVPVIQAPAAVGFEAGVPEMNTTLPTVVGSCEPGSTVINCSDPGVLVAIEMANKLKFPDMAKFEYGMPVQGSTSSKCDVEWRFKPRTEKSARMYRDYREYTLFVNSSCDYVVEKIGKWHSGKRAMKKDSINDTIASGRPLSSFWKRKYLYYSPGGDKCKSMSQYVWSFLCALGEAQYLNRTFVLDLRICLSASNNPGHGDEEDKDFRLYFDYEHLRQGASVVEQQQFLKRWQNWDKKHPWSRIKTREVEDYTVQPMELKRDEKSTIIWRKFERPEPDNYWYRVCEGESEKVIHRPWNLLWKSKHLMNIVNSICGKMEWDFDVLHVVRGKKAEDHERWPNLDKDTSPEALLDKLSKSVDPGRRLYIASNEQVEGYFDKLRTKYKVFLLNDFKNLWAPGSEWFNETRQLVKHKQLPEFDGYMRAEVDSEVVFRARKRIETFGELTMDCKNGVGTC